MPKTLNKVEIINLLYQIKKIAQPPEKRIEFKADPVPDPDPPKQVGSDEPSSEGGSGGSDNQTSSQSGSGGVSGAQSQSGNEGAGNQTSSSPKNFSSMDDQGNEGSIDGANGKDKSKKDYESAPGILEPDTGGSDTKSTKPTGTGGGVSLSIRNDISEMQRAIQEFAKTAAVYETNTRLENGKVIREVKPEDKRMDFNNFLVEQFSETEKTKGKEFSTNPQHVDKQSKMPTELVEYNVVLDSLRRLGSRFSEEIRDGIWDFRTNNAVKNTYALAAAVVTAYEELGGLSPFDTSIFNRSDLVQLEKLIPEEYEPRENKALTQSVLAKKAKLITPLVKKLTKFYVNFSKYTMGHAAYKQYINQELPLYTFAPGGTDPYKPDPKDRNQKKFMENPSTFIIPVLNLPNKSGQMVPIINTLTLESFKSTEGIIDIMTKYLGYQPNEVNNPRLLRRVVQSILNEVQNFIKKYSTTQPRV